MITNFGFNLDYQRIDLNNRTTLTDQPAQLPALFILPNNDTQHYDITKFNATLTRSFRLILKNAFFANSEIGIANIARGSLSQKTNFNNLIGKFDISQKHDLFKTFGATFQAVYTQTAVATSNIYENYYPTGTTSFRKMLNTEVPQKIVNVNYSFGYLWPFEMMTSSFLVFWRNNLTSHILNNQYSGIVNYSTDSLVKNDTHQMLFSFHHQFPSLFLNTLFTLNANYSSGSRLIQNASSIITLPYSVYSVIFSAKKNWNKKYFLRFDSHYSNSSFKFPGGVLGNSSRKIVYFRNSLYQRWVMNSQMNLMANVSFYQNNLFSPNKAEFLMADLEWTYQIKNKPLFISAKADNLTNQENFYTFQNTALVQSFSTIPLIKRNLYLSLKYSF